MDELGARALDDPATTAGNDGQRRSAAPVRTWIGVLAGVWCATVAVAVAVAVLPGVASDGRALLGLHLSAAVNPVPSLGRVAAIAVHNVQVAGWPLLLPLLGVSQRRSVRLLADALVVGSLLVNAGLVGIALGGYQARLLAFVPQLPIEWAGLAIGPAAWCDARREPLQHRHLLASAAAMAVLLIAAAIVETWCVPHR